MPRRVAFLVSLAIAVGSYGCRSEPADPEAIFTARTLGVRHLERGQLAEAEEQFRKIIELAPNDAFGYANLGLTHMQAGRYAEAEAQLRRARRLDPGNADVGRMLAKLYALSGRREEARTTLEALRTAQPRDPKVLWALAELEEESGASAAAARAGHLRQVVEIAPANVAARLELAEALIALGQADSALRQIEEFRRLRP